MIEIQFVVGFAMAITNTFKKKIPACTVPFASILVAVVLNLFNAYLFGGDFLLAGKEAFVTAGITVGMFAAGGAKRGEIKRP